MKTETPEYPVFPNGTSCMIWYERNCDRCWKGPVRDQNGHNRKCAIENAIALGAATDGTLLHDGTTTPIKAARIAERLGWDGVSYLESDCPEREEKKPYQSRARTQDKTTPTML